jgi:hypothetical protein
MCLQGEMVGGGEVLAYNSRNAPFNVTNYITEIIQGMGVLLGISDLLKHQNKARTKLPCLRINIITHISSHLTFHLYQDQQHFFKIILNASLS